MSKHGSVGTGQRVGTQAGGLLRRFGGDRSGSASMLFGLLIIPLAAVVGLAVDFGRVYAIKSHTQAALDAAALAAGRVAQLPGSTTEKTSAAATAYFNQTKPTGVVTSTLQFSPNAQQTEFRVTATSWIRTPFLGVLHMLNNKGGEAGAPPSCVGNHYGCVRVSSTATAALCPSSACISNTSGGEKIEVSLMLDVTGSMCTPCSKITALKTAAKDLIDIVVPADVGVGTVRVALAPFAEAVNVGSTLAPLVRGTVTENVSSDPQRFTSSAALSDVNSQPTHKWIRFASVNNSNSNGCTNDNDRCTWRISTKCVTERIGAEAFTDAPPSTAFVGKGYFGDSDSDCGVANHSDTEVNLVMPLSSDRSALKARIDKLSTNGSTAGHLGTAWAYYLLSPKWNYLFPTASAAAAYSDVIDPRPNKPKTGTVRKVAVLMTDGEYNINYCKGVEAKNSDQSPDINCNSENAKSLVQAASLCTSMKEAKVKVYTVGFQVNATAKTFLQNCASDLSDYRDAANEAELQAAFRDIALNIASLRLTN